MEIASKFLSWVPPVAPWEIRPEIPEGEKFLRGSCGSVRTFSWDSFRNCCRNGFRCSSRNSSWSYKKNTGKTFERENLWKNPRKICWRSSVKNSEWLFLEKNIENFWRDFWTKVSEEISELICWEIPNECQGENLKKFLKTHP